MQLGPLKGINVPIENSNTSDFYSIKIIFADVYKSQDLFLGVYTDFIIGN